MDLSPESRFPITYNNRPLSYPYNNYRIIDDPRVGDTIWCREKLPQLRSEPPYYISITEMHAGGVINGYIANFLVIFERQPDNSFKYYVQGNEIDQATGIIVHILFLRYR